MSVHDLLAAIAPYLARRTSHFASSTGHPHRIVSNRPEAITEYHSRLLEMHERSVYGRIDALASLASDVVIKATHHLGKELSDPMITANLDLVYSLLIDNDLVFAFPSLDPSLIAQPNYVVPFRRRLQELEPILVHQAVVTDTFRSIATSTVAAIAEDYLPDVAFTGKHTESSFTVPLRTLIKRPRNFVEQTFATFLGQQQHNTTEPYALAFWNTRHRLFENMLTASRMTLEQALKNQHKMIFPGESDLDTEELITTYLAGTPFMEFLQTPMPFTLTARFSHHHIVATPGAGKTNLIEVLLANDFEQVAQGKATVIVLDSQGDLINRIVRRKEFAPGGRLHERLVYIDPTDVEYPLELNFFARRSSVKALTPLEKRTEHSNLVDLLLFLFGALKQEATGRQETLIKAVASLIQEIPDATLMTLNDIFQPGDKKKPVLANFESHLVQLSEPIRNFFAFDFNSGEFSQTRAQIRARIQSLITDPVFLAMFGATSQKLDFAHEMNSGRVILINAYEDLLKTSTEIFGRFFLALAAQVAQARQNIAEEQRLPTYCYIDECYKFIKADTNVETVLDTGRKYRLGIIIAHQRLNQLSDALRSAASSAAIKMVRAPVSGDSGKLASQLHTTPVYFDALPDYAFATYITGMPGPVTLKIPPSPLASSEEMSDEEFAAVREVMRRKYARPYTSSSAVPPASASVRGDQKVSPSAAPDPITPSHEMGPISPQPDVSRGADELFKKPSKDWLRSSNAGAQESSNAKQPVGKSDAEEIAAGERAGLVFRLVKIVEDGLTPFINKSLAQIHGTTNYIDQENKRRAELRARGSSIRPLELNAPEAAWDYGDILNTIVGLWPRFEPIFKRRVSHPQQVKADILQMVALRNRGLGHRTLGKFSDEDLRDLCKMSERVLRAAGAAREAQRIHSLQPGKFKN
jgi:hypothetical protein